MEKERILVIGACGQIGVELVEALRKRYGNENVIASDKREESPLIEGTGPFVKLDAMEAEATKNLVQKEHVTTIYLLAALLSAKAEEDPAGAWTLNIGSLRQILDLGKNSKVKIFWPSSIAAFGPTTPDNPPQSTIAEPTTMYGVTKYSGELLCQYYNRKYRLDVRSVRYPGLIGWKSGPGGGTTDYAVDIFRGAVNDGKYTCFLSENTYLPMMYMDDAIRATIELMESPAENVKTRMSYNLSAMSFSPKEVAEEIKKHISNFEMSYDPDPKRQKIADSWPSRIDDSTARSDWGWEHKYDLPKMVVVMLENLKRSNSETNNFASE